MSGRAFRAIAVGAALLAACTSFGADEPTPTVDGGAAEAGVDVVADAGAADTNADVDLANVDTSIESCATAPANSVFCDDFTTPSFDAWNTSLQQGNPEYKGLADAGAHIESSATAPSLPNVATFVFPGRDGTENCTYVWARALFDVKNQSPKRLDFAFDLNLLTVAEVQAGGDKNAIAFFIVKDATGAYTEHYLMVTEPKHATIYEQWKMGPEDKAESATHEIGAIPLNGWIHVDLVLDASTHQAQLAINGQARSTWTFGNESFANTFDGTTQIGIGYACTTIGGSVQFDNVLLTAQ